MDNKKLVCIVLAVFVALSWYMGIDNASSSASGYKDLVKSGKNYEEQELYQLAINDYQSALTYEDTLDLRLKVCDLYKAGMANGEITGDGNYVSMLLDTMSTYADEPKAYEAAISYFYSILNYDELISALKAAKEFDIKSDVISEIDTKVKYLFERQYSTFSEPNRLNFGYYLVKTTGEHYSINTSLNIHLENCEFLTPYSANGMSVVKKEDKVFIVDINGVRQKYLDKNIVASSGIADGNIACKVGETWAYYDVNGEKLSKDYYYASRFCAGVAAVQEKEGEWRLINTEYNYLSETVYEDIKLDDSENCSSSGVILAKSKGKYNLISISGYNPDDPSRVKLEAIDGFSCDDCDLPVDASISSNNGVVWFAFKSNDKWGYADCEGKITIEPKFALAKSFSNGYAAVSEDGKLWNFADTQGNVVIKTDASDASYFAPNGICFVQFDESYWTYIRMYYWDY